LVSGPKLINISLILLLNIISKKSTIKIFQFAQKRGCPKLPAKSETQKFEVFWTKKQSIEEICTNNEVSKLSPGQD
jgi:hypothetical protein